MGGACRTNGEKNAYRLLVGKQEGKRQLEDQDVDGWIILGWILERCDKWIAPATLILNLRVP
jgi:hypothetical protein